MGSRDEWQDQGSGVQDLHGIMILCGRESTWRALKQRTPWHRLEKRDGP
jgi:hypothetical protein